MLFSILLLPIADLQWSKNDSCVFLVKRHIWASGLFVYFLCLFSFFCLFTVFVYFLSRWNFCLLGLLGVENVSTFIHKECPYFLNLFFGQWEEDAFLSRGISDFNIKVKTESKSCTETHLNQSSFVQLWEKKSEFFSFNEK